VRFVTAEQEGHRFGALLEDETVTPIRGVEEIGRETPLHLLVEPPLDRAGAMPLAEVTLLAPVPSPGKVLCVGLNYMTHVDETRRELPTYPVLFAKYASSLIGPFAPISHPPESTQVDYEGEMAVIIGERVRRVPRDRALAAVAGLAVANDVTMRDFQYKTHQWIQGKAWDSSTPLGPALVTLDEVGDPADLDIELRLNGERMQAANTSQLIFDVPTLVATVSEFTTLEAGDILLTGTPGGVGYRRDPQVFLRDGDVVSVEVSSLGTIENRVVTEVPA
jgi:acylpyruvate hydrolase